MQLVVVSPLIRALETAAGVFGVDAAEATEAHVAQQAQQAERQQDAAQGPEQGPEQGQQQGQQRDGDNGVQSRPGSTEGEAESMDTDPPALLMRAQVRARPGLCKWAVAAACVTAADARRQLPPTVLCSLQDKERNVHVAMPRLIFVVANSNAILFIYCIILPAGQGAQCAGGTWCRGAAAGHQVHCSGAVPRAAW